MERLEILARKFSLEFKLLNIINLIIYHHFQLEKIEYNDVMFGGGLRSEGR